MTMATYGGRNRDNGVTLDWDDHYSYAFDSREGRCGACEDNIVNATLTDGRQSLSTTRLDRIPEEHGLVHGFLLRLAQDSAILFILKATLSTSVLQRCPSKSNPRSPCS